MKRFFAMILAFVLCAGCCTALAPAMADTVTGVGTGTGFGGDVTVTLTVENGVLTSVVAEGAYESVGIGTPALEALPAAMLEANTVKVDVMTNATSTSYGVLDAAAAALENAGLTPADLVAVEVADKVAGDEEYVTDVVVIGAGLAEDKFFDPTPLKKLPGYKTNADNWSYAGASVVYGSDRPFGYTDTHIVDLSVNAIGPLNKAGDVTTDLMVIAIDKWGNGENIKNVYLSFRAPTYTCALTLKGGYAYITPETKEVLKYLTEGRYFTCTIELYSSETITFYASSDELTEFLDAAKALYNSNVADYIGDTERNYATSRELLTIEINTNVEPW